MYRVLSCLTVQHDYRLVLLAVFVCAAAALACFKIYSQVAASQGLRRSILLFLTGVCSASGIWATHFIAMLAYETGVPIAYDPAATAASFLIAVAATTSGFVISAGAGRWPPAVGGSVIGVGIGLMHFAGMRALIVPGILQWDVVLVVASLVIGTVLASAAVIGFHTLSVRRAPLIAAGLFASAILGLHFTAMGAAVIVPDPRVLIPPSPIDGTLMAVAVSGAALAIVLSGLVSTALMENQLRRQREEELRIMAQHDALTDLPNRVLLRERLERALAGARRGGASVAVLMLDLDRFKEVNDTLGHPVGDALLKAVALRLRSCLRGTASIARFGGDEFAILEDMMDPVAEATALAERIRTTLCAPFDLGDHQVVAGTSIGIAVAPRDGTDSGQILKNADLALYRAKSSGRGTHRFFEPEMDRLMLARRDLERDMRHALTNGELELHYQPFVNLESGEISGCEALLRWHHPARGLVSPADFIPLAEETGIIVPLGEWVLKTACAEAAKWPAGFRIAVNLSPAQLRSADLVPVVVRALAASRIASHRLELEVTESVMMQDSKAAYATLGRLHKLGVRIALDDFGTGYSSLSFLQGFPFDKIKIDRSFVNGLTDAKAESRLIARAVVRFAVSLGKTTTAEGVETQEQLDLLRAERCTEMQGYFFSWPRSSSEVAKLLLAHSAKAATAA